MFDWFLIDFGAQVGAKLDQKLIKKRMQNDMQRSSLKNPREKKKGYAGNGGVGPLKESKKPKNAKEKGQDQDQDQGRREEGQ